MTFNPVSITLWCVVLTSDCLHQSLYQDRKELLEADAQKLSLMAVTKDAKLDALVTRTAPASRNFISSQT